MIRQGSRRLLFAAFVAVALAAAYGLAGRWHSAPATGHAAAKPARAVVTSVVRACAAPGSAGVTSAALVMAAMPGAQESAGSTHGSAPQHGLALVTRLVPGGSPAAGQAVTTVTRPAESWIGRVATAPALPKGLQATQPGSSPKVSTQTARGGVQVTAAGPMAQGLAVEQATPGGLVTGQCGSPGTSFWFIGPGQALAADIDLYLMNTDGQAADAQVTAISDVTKGGPVLGNADNGITVPPHSMVVQSLGTLLQSSKIVALNVSTSVGRVVAALRESRTATQPGGWLPPTAGPGRNLVIPGLPAAGGTPELYVAVPGTAAADIKVTAITAKGSYRPTGGIGIDLIGGSVAGIPLPSLTGVAGAVKISASAPVVASMLVSGGPVGMPGAVAVSARPVQEQGVLAAGPAGSTSLVLSAPGHAAAARVVVATASAPAASQAGTVIQVKAGTSVVVPIRAPAGHRAARVMVVVSPLAGSGPVYAGWVISSGRVVQSVLPVLSSLTWIPEPAVRSSFGAVLP